MKLSVYIPAPGSELEETVWPGSGMVGSEVNDTGRIRVDYEGDQEVYLTYEQRGGRAYMTRACAHVGQEEVVEVGWWAPIGGRLEIADKVELPRSGEHLAPWFSNRHLAPLLTCHGG